MARTGLFHIMIAVDTNILICAHRTDSSNHQQARQTVLELAEGQVAWAIAWHFLAEFFNIVTHPKIYAPPSAPAQAIAQIEAWMESPTLSVLSETNMSWGNLKPLLLKTQVQGPKVFDVRIAALCLEHGVTQLLTADRGFVSFPELVVKNPL
ncbi:MAG: TA system VapC family ribonuclease toxin [Pseudomonadota bacterium]